MESIKASGSPAWEKQDLVLYYKARIDAERKLSKSRKSLLSYHLQFFRKHQRANSKLFKSAIVVNLKLDKLR